MSPSITLPGLRPGALSVMAIACGVMVASIYVCQPLLAEMARQLGVTAQTAALVAVVTQIGYTAGILFVVPLADVADPSRLVRTLLVLTACGLVGAALAPGIGVLLLASFTIATTAVVAQILIPFATTLGLPEQRGRIVGTLMTGLILGILLSRTVSGLVASLTGSWRAPFVLEASLVLLLRLVLPQFMPARANPPQHTAGYRALLASLPGLLAHRPLRLSMSLNFFSFAAFSAVWASLAFHLATPAFGLGAAAAGLFGLWGAPGALLAPMAGRLADRWGSARVNALGLLAMAACFTVAITWGRTSLAGLVLTVNLLDFGQQSGQVANQTRIFGLGASIRGRLNTLYMATTFAGGAVGALAAGYAWAFAGWRGVCTLGGSLVGIAGLILLVGVSAARANPQLDAST